MHSVNLVSDKEDLYIRTVHNNVHILVVASIKQLVGEYKCGGALW